VEEWVTIRELAQKKVSVSEIARRTGHDRKTVRKVLAEAAPRPHGNAGKEKKSKLEPYREYLLQRIEQGCLNGTVLLEEITRLGYTGKISILRQFLTPIRQELLRKQEATERFETGPGKQAQVDWASFGKVWDPGEQCWKKLFAFIFTLGYSRAVSLEFTTCCDLEHFLACHLNAFAALGIPETILYDNLKTAIIGRKRDGTPILPERFLEFALFHGFTPRFCKPYRAKTKGKVERAVSYVRANFWVRVSHTVANGQLDRAGLNEQAKRWAAEVANVRVHGTHGEVVAQRLAAEQPFLGKLTGRPRFETSYHTRRQVGRDGRLSYRGRLYQVAVDHARQEVEVIESLVGELTIRAKDGRVLPAEVVAASATRPIYRAHVPEEPKPTTAGRLRVMRSAEPEVQVRDLAVYEEVARAASAG